MGRIQNAETDLMGRLEQLRRIARDTTVQRDQLQAHHERLAALLEVEPERSLA
jgi:hypothetical protein